MIVMGLGGLWHGAGLSYLLWGLFHGVLLVAERPFLGVLQAINSPVLNAMRITVVFSCVTMLWIFFKLPNFDHALGYLAGMFAPSTNPAPPKLFYNLALLYSLPVILQHFRAGALFDGGLRRWEPYAYGALAALAYLEAGPETAFIYFQF
jgi:alginate O-acetyltransferase complex protein AlgI